MLGDRINLGIALVVPAEDDMDGRRRAEPARKGDMPGVIEALASEEHYLLCQERIADGADLVVRERSG